MNPTPTRAGHTAGQHSPLPWKVDCSNEVLGDGEGGESFSEWLNIKAADGTVICELPGHSQYARASEMCKKEDANAAFIVEAVNQHDGLVAIVAELADIPLTEEVPGIAAKFPEMDDLVQRARNAKAGKSDNAALQARVEGLQAALCAMMQTAAIHGASQQELAIAQSALAKTT